jgi:Fanconi-associated nuclease 1
LTSVPKHSIDVVPIQIVCHKTSDAKVNYDDEVFKSLWKNAQRVIESTKSCPPSAIKYQDNFCVVIREVLRSSSHLLTDDEKNFMGMHSNARVVIFLLFPFNFFCNL